MALEALVLRPLGLGDFLTSVPALRAIVRALPAHRHILAEPAALVPLLGLVDGTRFDVLITAPLQPIVGIDRPAVAIDLHGRGPESHRLLQALRPERLIAFGNREVNHDGPMWLPDEHEVHRWCRMLDESGIPSDPGDLDLARPPASAPPEAQDAVVIHPGAASGARRWPVDRWVEVASRMRAQGAPVVVTGGVDEVGLARTVARQAGLEPAAVLAGSTDLVQLAAVVATARMVLSGDTGIAHLATALRTPSVVLFGPVSPDHWGPPKDRPWHRTLWAGATGDPHADQPHSGLLRISVEDVMAEVAQLLGPARRVEPATC